MELLTKLDHRKITFWKDEIPHQGLHDRRIRVFVFGCDIQEVFDLQKKYSI